MVVAQAFSRSTQELKSASFSEFHDSQDYTVKPFIKTKQPKPTKQTIKHMKNEDSPLSLSFCDMKSDNLLSVVVYFFHPSIPEQW